MNKIYFIVQGVILAENCTNFPRKVPKETLINGLQDVIYIFSDGLSRSLKSYESTSKLKSLYSEVKGYDTTATIKLISLFLWGKIFVAAVS